MALTNKKPGCLSIFFPFLKFFQKGDTQALPYRLRDDFLSPAEFSFYKVLASLLGERWTVQSKVRLADVFFVSRPNENISFFNRIAQKHLDFLVCDSASMKPVFGIELDDSSHRRSNRQVRDAFVEDVCKAAGLPLLRVPVQREYNSREIAAQIAPILKANFENPTPKAQPAPENPLNAVPICPKCDISMVLRTVAQGEHKGKQFYGCQNYPKCRVMKPVKAQVA
jgi:very-short-patch-repair endonuclease